MKIFPNLILSKKNYSFSVTSTLTCIKMKILQDAKGIFLCRRQFLMMLRIILSFIQITKSPTLITCSSASLTDYISGSLFEAISQNGVINVDLSDYELIYCTRKISTIKTGGTDKELKSRLLKNARLMLIKML